LILSVPQTNPFYVNPTGVAGPVQVYEGSTPYFGVPVTDSRVDTGNFSLGFSTSEWRGWSASGFAAYTFENQHAIAYGAVSHTALVAALADSSPTTAFNPFGGAAANNPATLAAIASNDRYDWVSAVKTINLSITSPALTLPGGDAHLVVGSEHRIQSLAALHSSPATFPLTTHWLARSPQSSRK
jgi:hypothetical protein